MEFQEGIGQTVDNPFQSEGSIAEGAAAVVPETVVKSPQQESSAVVGQVNRSTVTNESAAAVVANTVRSNKTKQNVNRRRSGSWWPLLLALPLLPLGWLLFKRHKRRQSNNQFNQRRTDSNNSTKAATAASSDKKIAVAGVETNTTQATRSQGSVENNQFNQRRTDSNNSTKASIAALSDKKIAVTGIETNTTQATCSQGSVELASESYADAACSASNISAKKKQHGRIQFLESESNSTSHKNTISSGVEQVSIPMADTGLGARSDLATPAQEASDDLTAIHGIDCEVQELLNKNGIVRFSQMQDVGSEGLHAILFQCGSKFNKIDPESWPTQASYALKNDWSGLRQWQLANLPKSRSRDGLSDSAELEFADLDSAELESARSSSERHSTDDLTLIVGVGPATSKLLNQLGIHKFEQIAEMPSDQLAEMVQAADARFNLVDSSTWAAQAISLLTLRDSLANESSKTKEAQSANS